MMLLTVTLQWVAIMLLLRRVEKLEHTLRRVGMEVRRALKAYDEMHSHLSLPARERRKK